MSNEKENYEPEELRFVLPKAVEETFPLELDFSQAGYLTDNDVIKAVNEKFNATFPENETATRYMDGFEKEEIRKEYCQLVESELPVAKVRLLDAVEEAKRLRKDAENSLESLEKQIADLAAEVHEGTKEKSLPATKTFRVALNGWFLYYAILGHRVKLVKAVRIQQYDKSSLWSQEDRNRIAMNELFGLEFPEVAPPSEDDLDLEPDGDGTDEGEDGLNRALGYGGEGGEE